MPASVSVLFVCLGNICRSPMAEAVFRDLVARRPPTTVAFDTIDSCGTAAYHVGASPDPRTSATLRRHGITTYRHAARQVARADFTTFDYIFAMDPSNLADLLQLRVRVAHDNHNNSGALAEVRLLGDFQPGVPVAAPAGDGQPVPDPYYGGDDGFEQIYHQIVGHAEAFLHHLESRSRTA
ncbi:Low molecular weight phosphotyrosine protein phosphatase [Ophidiomyces ophidiicola]|nr:Low molecular weight phosphotyrosine protein phosphatase [Ophidiomyces ophidiicola]KAI2326878.1 Low molecular weight phosphotyrosine protein phosphatase [Ophidiomyces ophidiicola]KAI2423646.1 Low molecular weight phosphotyrosine protein phosphatase [Ophidiomyces ophidiicola]KAI2441786.1 Low molecular weight phosphotyrosine protein phosphatase [Ophidiomyces ophidiicola]